ncbi:MAG: CoA transferase [Actinomycetota bacterium]|nr:CoA transferase [Actinomycetota bacterium]
MTSERLPAALTGYRVIELASERCALAGKLLADMGAEVIVVEPPGGCHTRNWEPFADDVPELENSLHWWHYNTSKKSVIVDLDTDIGADTFRSLVDTADVVIEAEPLGRLDALGLDWNQFGGNDGELIWTSITHHGRDGTDPPATDLTLLAEGGPVWSCGYDDHQLPPVRGGGNQAFHTACHYAVPAILVALMWRETSGKGQLVDISMLGAANATTEFATLWWLNAEREVGRQTGRHAHIRPTEWTQIRCADGRWFNTGVPPRNKREFAALRTWVEELGLVEECSPYEILKLGDKYERIGLFELDADPLAGEVFQAGRDVIEFLGQRLSAYELFVGLQERGMACGIVYSPEEMMQDPHFVERGFPVDIFYEDRDTSFTHPGAPYRFGRTPWRAKRAPLLGEHQTLIEELSD